MSSGGGSFFDRAVELNDPPVRSGLCSVCKGAHRLCGKDRCPLMIKFYSQQRTMPMIDAKDLAGSSPPSVFVGRYGYPKVDIGPLLPPEFGDTAVMDRPEMWVGKSIDEIVETASRSWRWPRGRWTWRRRSPRSPGAGSCWTTRSSPSAPPPGWRP